MLKRFINWVARKSPEHKQLRIDFCNQTITREEAEAARQVQAAALEEIITTINGITTPNGTLRKVRRIAITAAAA